MTLVPNDPLLGQQWQFGNAALPGFDLNILPAWADYSGAGVLIAINDDGVRLDHPDLTANIDRAKSYDSASGQWGVNDLAAGDTHGTRVAGCAGEVGNNGIGGAGAAHGATLAALRGSDGVGLPYVDQGMSLAYDIGADIVNNSWGPAHLNGASNLETWENFALSGRDGLGGVTVVSAGNARTQSLWSDYGSQDSSPMSMVIGAVADDGRHTYFSSPGANLLATAPGEDVLTTAVDGGYTTTSGTSFSAPLTAGVSALVLEANPALGSADVIDIMAYSARQTDTMTSWMTDAAAARAEVWGTLAGMSSTVAGLLDVDRPASAAAVPDALVAKLQPVWDWADNHADDWNGGGLTFNPDYGFGLVDAHAAVRLAESWGGAAVRPSDLVQVSLEDKTAESLIGTGETVTLTRTFTVDQDITLQNAMVELEIPDGHPDGLTVTLTAPSGTVSHLFGQYSTVLDLAGAKPGTVEYYLSHQASGLTFNLNDSIDLGSRAVLGESAAGEWTVTVSYENLADTPGPTRLTEVGLDLIGYAADADDRYVYSDAYGDLAGRDGRSVLTDSDGGTDQLNAAMLTDNAVLDLNAGATSTLAGASLTIADGTVIENAWAGDGNDTVTGNDAANVLHGARGHDELFGGEGADTLDGGRNNDALTGGDGADTFRFDALAGFDTIVDYVDGTDRIEILAATGTTSFADLTRVQDGANTLLTLGDGGQILMSGIQVDSLDSGDFVFV